MSDPNRRSPARHKCTSGRLLGHHRVLRDEYLAHRHVAVATCRTRDASDSPRVRASRVEPSARHAAAGGKTNRRPNSNFEFKGVIGGKLNRRLGIRIRSDHWAPINRRGDSKNDALSGSADITGSSSSGTSTSTLSSEAASTASGLVKPTSRRREGAARLGEILQVGPSTRPDNRFVIELNRAPAAPPPPAVIVVEEGASFERTASQASTSGREGSKSSESTAPVGEPVDDRNRPASWAMQINDRRVYHRSAQKMVELAEGHPVYSVNYFTSAVNPRYLAALRREFQIPAEVELRVPGENDLPSRPPPGYITLSAEYFRAGLRLPFHPFLRQALTRLNVAPAQLNAKAFQLVQDEVGSLVDGLLLLPGLQGDVHHHMPGLRQVVQTPVVLRGRSVAARASYPERTPSGREGSGGIPEGLCVDSGATHTGEDCGHGGRPSEFGRGRTGPAHAAQPG
ncbi:hypothetical protein TIFTF001_051181 [Ficus carica]|nr:hypothetical protein TIFTF001_051181 [Ficus carica]